MPLEEDESRERFLNFINQRYFEGQIRRLQTEIGLTTQLKIDARPRQTGMGGLIHHLAIM
jgi:hypothetical protein